MQTMQPTPEKTRDGQGVLGSVRDRRDIANALATCPRVRGSNLSDQVVNDMAVDIG